MSGRHYVGSSEPDPTLPAGFRVHADELPDRVALAAVSEAADAVCRAALEARRMLLGLGFADSHSVCLLLDATARQYAGTRYAAAVAEGARRVDDGPAL